MSEITEHQAAVDESTVQEPSLQEEEVKKEPVEGDNTAEPENGSTDEEKTVRTVDELEEDIKRFQQRIKRQTAANKAMQERYEALMKEKEKQQVNSKTTTNIDALPEFYDFEGSAEEYKELVDNYVNQQVEKSLQDQEAKRKEEFAQQESSEMQKKFAQAEVAFRKQNPDYDDKANELATVLDDLSNIGLDTTLLRQLIVSHDNAPQIVHKLGSDTSKVEYMAGLDPIKMMLEFVKIEGGGSKTKDNVKQLPTPIKPTSGNGSTKSIDDMSGKELLKRYNIK